MSFIQNLIQQNNQQKEEQLKKEYSYTIIHLEDNISTIKKGLAKIKNDRKDVTIDFTFVDEFAFDLILLEKTHVRFLFDLKAAEYDSEHNCFTNRKENARKKAEFMQKLKKQYRVEFEKIYDTFKRITKGCNFPRRNEILNKMRKAFDFDSNIYYSKTQLELISKLRG